MNHPIAARTTGLFLIAALLTIGCDRGGKSASGKGQPKIGYTIHILNEFTGVAQRGAEDAGKTLGADVDVQGPSDGDTNAAIGVFEGMVQRGVDGIVTMPMPGELWVTPIRKASEVGVPVVTANVTSPGSASAAWFGQDEYNSGVILAAELRKLLAAAGKTRGAIVVGVCVPGVGVLVQRYEGLKKGMAGSEFTVSKAYNVEADQTTNYAKWEGLAGSHPDAVAMVGLCSMDLPNLARLKTRTKADWIVAGYDLNVETVKAIRDGTVHVAIGQHPYLQGYLPVRALVEHVRDKKPLPKGWIDVGTEVVTKDNVDAVYQRETDRAAEQKWYAEHMAKHFADLNAVAKSMPR